jgi:ATP adenylyltransferase
MDYLWTPWRYKYIADASKDDRCVFCDAVSANDDRNTLIVFRGNWNFIILNRFPYTSGHLMVVPFEHVADLAKADPAALAEMMHLAQRAKTALENTYRPQGFNLGMNLGRAAGDARRARGTFHHLRKAAQGACVTSVFCLFLPLRITIRRGLSGSPIG